MWDNATKDFCGNCVVLASSHRLCFLNGDESVRNTANASEGPPIIYVACGAKLGGGPLWGKTSAIVHFAAQHHNIITPATIKTRTTKGLSGHRVGHFEFYSESHSDVILSTILDYITI